MTNSRITPAAPAVELSPIAAELVSAERTESAVTAIVRELVSAERQSLVSELVSAVLPTDPTVAAVLPFILSAPFGPDPAVAVMDSIAATIDRLAAFVHGAAAMFPEFNDGIAGDELAAMFDSAMTRVTPMTADSVTAIVTPTPVERSGRRTRQTVARDWQNVDGVAFTTPGRPGLSPTNMMTVHVGPNGDPTFTTPDGESFNSPTAALRHADRWTNATGWGNPFDVCRELRPTGSIARTLGAMTKV